MSLLMAARGRGMWRVVVLVMMSDPIAILGRGLWPTVGRVLPAFLSAVCGEVKQVACREQWLQPARIGRIRVEDTITDADKATESRQFALRIGYLARRRE